MINEAVKTRMWTYESELLQELSKLERSRRAKVERELMPLVAQTKEKFES